MQGQADDLRNNGRKFPKCDQGRAYKHPTISINSKSDELTELSTGLHDCESSQRQRKISKAAGKILLTISPSLPLLSKMTTKFLKEYRTSKT